jgi:hypothetical protein
MVRYASSQGGAPLTFQLYILRQVCLDTGLCTSGLTAQMEAMQTQAGQAAQAATAAANAHKPGVIGLLKFIPILYGGIAFADLGGGEEAAAEEAAGAASRTVVLRRNMADRVIPYAEKNGFDSYKGTPNWVARSLIERISPSALEKTDLWFNQRWIQSEMSAGSAIVDIGEPAGYSPSIFYNMEQQQVSGYWNYSQDLQP